jgi:hypothetical protein
MVNMRREEIKAYFGLTRTEFAEWRYWVWPSLHRKVFRVAAARYLAREIATKEMIIIPVNISLGRR